MAVRGFIGCAQDNSLFALCDAKEVWESRTKDMPYDLQGVAELVDVINTASVKLKNLCRQIKFSREHPE